jgi:hypothetical protein
MMNNTRLTVALLLALTFSIGTAGSLGAATLKCTVVEVDKQQVILDCGENSKKLQNETEVKVKTVKPKSAIEGC